MGAFGPGIFDDDSSLDWIEGDYSESGVAAVREALSRVTEMPSDEYLEFDDAVAARAAAEIVATAHEKPPEGLDQEDLATLRAHAADVADSADLVSMAREAATRIFKGQSELTELWTEDENNATEWHQIGDDTIARLAAIA